MIFEREEKEYLKRKDEDLRKKESKHVGHKRQKEETEEMRGKKMKTVPPDLVEASPSSTPTRAPPPPTLNPYNYDDTAWPLSIDLPESSFDFCPDPKTESCPSIFKSPPTKTYGSGKLSSPMQTRDWNVDLDFATNDYPANIFDFALLTDPLDALGSPGLW